MKLKNTNNNTTSNIRPYGKFAIISVLILISIVSSFIVYKKINQNNSVTPDTKTTEETNTIDYSPATEQEKQESDQNKDDLVKRSQQESAPSNGQKKTVTPVITNADQSAINAYIEGVFEEGGICSFVLTQNSRKIDKTTNGFANATNTSCEPLFLSRSDYPSAGTWNVTVSYSSPTAQGTSQTKEFNVQ